MVRMEYTGKIPMLQGKTALVRKFIPSGQEFLKWGNKDLLTLAQFDDVTLVLNGHRLGFEWTQFSSDQFTPIKDKPVF
jgi:hypothetical protein